MNAIERMSLTIAVSIVVQLIGGHQGVAADAGVAPSADNASGLAEIVVTATKRTENLMDVPVSIAVLSGQELENTAPQSLIDLNGLVPGLTITSGGTPG